MRRITMTSTLALGLAFFGATGVAQAAPLVTNGNFDTTNTAVSSQIGIGSPVVAVTGWTIASGSYNFIFLSPTANANSQFGATDVGFFNAIADNRPGGGGNFIAQDPAFQTGAISQLITGLIPLANYDVTFDYAAAQQTGFSGPTTEGWTVSFGSETQSTSLINNPSQNFTGWFTQTFEFSADSSGQALLSFLAIGGPSSSQPPFSLLDNVSVTQDLPEPMTLSVFGAGVLGAAAWKRRKAAKAKA